MVFAPSSLTITQAQYNHMTLTQLCTNTYVWEDPRLGVSTAILATGQRRARHAHDASGSTGRGGDAEFVRSLARHGWMGYVAKWAFTL